MCKLSGFVQEKYDCRNLRRNAHKFVEGVARYLRPDTLIGISQSDINYYNNTFVFCKMILSFRNRHANKTALMMFKIHVHTAIRLFRLYGHIQSFIMMPPILSSSYVYGLFNVLVIICVSFKREESFSDLDFFLKTSTCNG